MRSADFFGTGVHTKERSSAFTKRCLAALFSIIVLPSLTWPQEEPLAPNQQVTPYTINVSVDMVVLHATVRNSKGNLVSGLGKDDFQVYEGGVLQEIKSFSHEDIPVTVGLVVDNSGSMGPKRSEVIAASLAFARSSNPADQMFVVSFNENVFFGLPADTPFTDKVTQLEVALSAISSEGMTALYDAVNAGLEHLKKGNRDKKVLIVISDGGDNASKHSRLPGLMAKASQSDAIIYAIGLFDPDDPDRNPHVLKQLAKTTGGEAFLPGSVTDIIPICERIARDIRNQYTIVYVPANRKQDGTYRVIQVKAGPQDHERLQVRTRAGYNAPLKLQSLPSAGATDHEVQN